jgi:hypothetical protein
MVMKRFIFIFIIFLTQIGSAMAQCAMCRTQLENNVSAGNPGIASGMNFGILYLLAMPYLAVLFLGYFWYRSSKNTRNETARRITPW